MRLLFSGDLGPDEKVFHPEPDAEQGFDYIICESTYGDRDRDDYTLEQRREALKRELVVIGAVIWHWMTLRWRRSMLKLSMSLAVWSFVS